MHRKILRELHAEFCFDKLPLNGDCRKIQHKMKSHIILIEIVKRIWIAYAWDHVSLKEKCRSIAYEIFKTRNISEFCIWNGLYVQIVCTNCLGFGMLRNNQWILNVLKKPLWWTFGFTKKLRKAISITPRYTPICIQPCQITFKTAPQLSYNSKLPSYLKIALRA